MARMSAKVIARIHTTSDGLAELSWEWIVRVDGQVQRRLTAVGGRRERNPWMDVAQLSARDLQALQRDHPRARAALESLARQRGHQASQARGQLHTERSVRPARILAGRHWESRLTGCHRCGRRQRPARPSCRGWLFSRRWLGRWGVNPGLSGHRR